MKTTDLLKNYAALTPEIQEVVDAAVEHAYTVGYMRGRKDQSDEMTQLATEADKRVSSLLEERHVYGSGHLH